jgi:hypothetical protein
LVFVADDLSSIAILWQPYWAWLPCNHTRAAAASASSEDLRE